METLFRWLNPSSHMSQETYSQFWTHLLSTTLEGVWSRILAIILLILAYWIGIRRERIQVAAILLIFAAIVMYSGGLINFIGR